jgi:hypothetical protein
MKESDVTFESIYEVPISFSAHLATDVIDPQAEYPTDLGIMVRDDGRGAAPGAPSLPHIPTAPGENVYSHLSAPYAMNAMALGVEAAILAQQSPWQWIPDTRIGHRGKTGIVVEQAPEIDPYTQAIMPEPREGFRGLYPYSLHQEIPFPQPWESL